jgi:hypothetical protein
VGVVAILAAVVLIMRLAIVIWLVRVALRNCGNRQERRAVALMAFRVIVRRVGSGGSASEQHETSREQ